MACKCELTPSLCSPLPDTLEQGATITQIRATLSSLVSHCLPKCLEALVHADPQLQQGSIKQQPHGRDASRTAYGTLSSFLSWLWSLTALPQRAARVTAQQLHQRLCAELFAVMEESTGGAPPAAAAAAAGDAGVCLFYWHPCCQPLHQQLHVLRYMCSNAYNQLSWGLNSCPRHVRRPGSRRLLLHMGCPPTLCYTYPVWC